MNLRKADLHIKQELKALYDDGESKAITALVLEECTGLSKEELRTNKLAPLTTEQEERIATYVQRLKSHEPLQYVMQKTWFYGLELYVDKSVLIPRPETEELVDWIVNDVKTTGKNPFQTKDAEADATKQLKILDVGTGSGCIALALKNAMPKAEVWGCDISEEALNVARRNGSALDVRVDFQGIDFLDEAQRRYLPTVDIIASNPPYIPLREKATMNPNVVEYEPHTALFVPNNDPLLFYKTILQFAKKRLYPDGVIYLEIHENLGKEVKSLFESEGFVVEVKKDMQGKDRMVKAKRDSTK